MRRCEGGAPEAARTASGLPGMYVGHLAFAPLIALYCLADRRRNVVVGAVGAVAVALAQFLPYPVTGVSELAVDRETLIMAMDSCVLAAGALVLGRTARVRRERQRELAEGREREHRLLAERTLSTERAWLAREMHDVVAHQVSLISLQAGALQVGEPDAATVRSTAGIVRELSAKTLTELQHMVGVLRAAGGPAPGLDPQPRLTDLPALVRDCGLRVTLDHPGHPLPLAPGGGAGRLPHGPGSPHQRHQARPRRRGGHTGPAPGRRSAGRRPHPRKPLSRPSPGGDPKLLTPPTGGGCPRRMAE
ncbi:sensor histidine kinase [Streptomyces sp. CS149]|uniref:sensor histidine kinase n=1 Tax=Streptomyces sp. CS149 TaxID=2109332 RepID=UPI001F1A73D8|nr:histidine kinase [Streptomyces sp. CS149]